MPLPSRQQLEISSIRTQPCEINLIPHSGCHPSTAITVFSRSRSTVPRFRASRLTAGGFYRQGRAELASDRNDASLGFHSVAPVPVLEDVVTFVASLRADSHVCAHSGTFSLKSFSIE